MTDPVKCPAGTVLIPEGFSQMGRLYTSGVEGKPVDQDLADQGPPHVVYLNSFCAQKYPVTNEERTKVTLHFDADQFELVRSCEQPSEEQKKYEACVAAGKNKKGKNKCVETVHKVATVDIYLASGPLEVMLSDTFQKKAQENKGSCSIITRKITDYSQSRSPKGLNGPCQPTVNMNAFEAEKYCQIVGEKFNLVGRLPTEAEKEKMARGKNSESPMEPDMTPHSLAEPRAFIFPTKTEKVLTSRDANYGVDTTQPVGSFPPTAFGLYDLIGIWEWTSDWYAPQYLAGASIVFNPTGPKEGEITPDEKKADTRVIRGGGFRDLLPRHLSATYRADKNPYILNDETGFRCVFDQKQGDIK